MPDTGSDNIHVGAGVHSLDHFAFSVPDLDVAENFYRRFGLDVRRTEDGLELRTFGNEHVWVYIDQADRKRLRHLSFGAYEKDLPEFAARLKAAGVATVSAPQGFHSDALWFHDPAGTLLQIRAAPKSSPDAKRPVILPDAYSVERASPYRDGRPCVQPIGLSHALFFQPDIKDAVAFYIEILGVCLSDDAGPVAFLHGIHGSEHHLVAFAKSEEGIGYHHSAWAVTSIEQVGLGAAQMASAGFDRGWGLGRHVLGSNYFHYVRDPWGSYAEYSFDIDYIPQGQSWVGGYPDPENSFYLWGPQPPEDFTVNHEASVD